MDLGGRIQSAEAQIEEVKKGEGETGAQVKNLEAKVQELGKKLSVLQKNCTAWTDQVPTKKDWEGMAQGVHTFGAEAASLREQVRVEFEKVYRAIECRVDIPPHPSESEGPKPPPLL